MKFQPRQDEPDYKRIMLALFVSALVLFYWQLVVEWPRRQHLAQYTQLKNEEKARDQVRQASESARGPAEEAPALTRKDRLAQSPRIAVRSAKLHGSIALKGARIDDLTLAQYRQTLAKDSPEVVLFSPNGDDHAYFAEIGWVAADGKTRVPDRNTLWQTNGGKTELVPGGTVHLTWDNGEGQIFGLSIALDEHYMFTVTQHVTNRAEHAVEVTPYAYINRAYNPPEMANVISHEGPLGVFAGALEEIPYTDLQETPKKSFDHATGWFGFTDKYWLAALVPDQSGFSASFSYYNKGGKNRFQADYLGQSATVEKDAAAASRLRLFAGAKEIRQLDHYTQGDAVAGVPPIPLFDRAVDFGVLYFLTKPLFLMLNFFYTHIGNFGIAILMLTIVVKLAMFPLANKSYKSMAQMRRLQPDMLKLRERYADDQIGMQKAMMALYKKEKVNPASGCLPLLIQMPVFFALYKVLYVTIEMRHAPFFGWFKDLSEIDTSNIFTLFGLLPWDHPAFLHLGILPILFCITMIIQTSMQPAPTDPVQAKMIKYMPYLMLFLFAGFPAGLVLYWTWSNVLSILQQYVITKRHGGKDPKPGAGDVAVPKTV
jgi:YidC/Oxa1 family membrane protein insertase